MPAADLAAATVLAEADRAALAGHAYRHDSFDGDPSVLAGVVHDRLARRSLILITMDDFGDALAGWEWPDDRHQARDAVSAVGFLDQMQNAGLGDRVDKAVDLIAQGDGTKVYQQATADLDGSPTPAARAAGHNGSLSGGGSGLVVVPAVVGALLVAGGGFWLLRRRRAARAVSPFAFPQAVFAADEAADEEAIRRRAEAGMIALGEAVEDADPRSRPGLRGALDAYAAAGKVLDGARGIPDLAGVLALVAEGRDAYEGRPGALPLCLFDPLHGRAERRIGWCPLGRRGTLDVAACGECARAVGEHRAPRVLTDVTRQGHRVPYFEVAPADSVWAATGYGSLVPGPADGRTGDGADGTDAAGDPGSVAARVLRGDFARTRHAH